MNGPVEVRVRELHDQLSRYLHHVGSGGEVVVTVRKPWMPRAAQAREGASYGGLA